MLRIAFTGHRPRHLFGYDPGPWQDLSARLEHELAQLHPSEIITGGAQGFDQTAFWTAHRMRSYLDLRNIVYIPFQKQDSLWSENGLFGRKQFRKMLSLADDICDTDPGTGLPISKLMHHRNHRMVDDCDLLIALWCPKLDPMREPGGTAECMRYALSVRKRIICIDPYDRDAPLVEI